MAVANRQRLEPLRFLTLATIPRLELVGDACPWKRICQLAGILGTCLTQASRLVKRLLLFNSSPTEECLAGGEATDFLLRSVATGHGRGRGKRGSGGGSK